METRARPITVSVTYARFIGVSFAVHGSVCCGVRVWGRSGMGGGDLLGGRVRDGEGLVDLHVAGHLIGAGGVCGRGEGEEQARDACSDEERDGEAVAGEVTHWSSLGRTIPCARGRWAVRACGGWGCGRAWSLRGGPRW